MTKTVWRLAAIITLVAFAGLAAVGLAGAAILRMTLRPLSRVAATARKVSTLPLDRGEVALAVRVPEADTDPRTEVGQVGAALNAMLGHVSAALTARQASETRIRRFVADASHERGRRWPPSAATRSSPGGAASTPSRRTWRTRWPASSRRPCG